MEVASAADLNNRPRATCQYLGRVEGDGGLITDIERTAHHEAGHVVFGYRWLKELPVYAEVRSTEIGQGGCDWADLAAPLVNYKSVTPEDRKRLELLVGMLTAGDAAAETLTQRSLPELWTRDQAMARLFVSRYLPGVTETLDLEIGRQRRVAMEFFAQPAPWAQVELVARALLKAPNRRLERRELLVLLTE